MSLSAGDVLVLLGSAAAIALVLWYFLGSRQAVRAAAGARGVQEIVIRVEGGYDPAVVEVTAGRPVRLVFDRREQDPCSEEVVIGALGIRRDLPAFERTPVEFTPPAPGRYEFTCGMGMLHGAVIANAS